MSSEKLISALNAISRIAAEALRDSDAERKTTRRRSVERTPNAAPNLSFGMNVLAFMKKYGADLGGDRKFVLLLARLTKAESSVQISLADMKSHWNKMKSVTGGKFNSAYANRAKANGWIDTPSYGRYELAPDWKDIFNK